MVLTRYRNVIYLPPESIHFPEDSPMRGDGIQQQAMFSYLSPEQRVPQGHPLRKLRPLVDQVLKKLLPGFARMYARVDRPSIPPEKLLRALLLQVLYTVRSERLLREQLDYNLLFRWFVGLNMDDAVWDATVYSKHRKQLLEGDVAEAFFQEVVAIAKQHDLLSDEHFTVDGTLIEAWAGQKSFKMKEGGETAPPPDDPGNPTVDFHGEKRSNQTHQSTTDPEAKLYRKSKGREATLAYLGHVLMENRNGLAVQPRLTLASGRAEREAAAEMIQARSGPARLTVGTDKNHDTEEWVKQVRACRATPHGAQNNTNRSSTIDARTTRHAGYAISQKKRKRIEEIFGWMKTVALMRKARHRGRKRVAWMFMGQQRLIIWCAFVT
jgi:transposase